MKNKFWVIVSLGMLFFNSGTGTIAYAMDKNNLSEEERINGSKEETEVLIDENKDPQDLKEETSVENSSALLQGTWGSSQVDFDEATGTLTIYPGTIGGNQTGFDKKRVRNIVILPGVILPKDSSYLFSFGGEQLEKIEGAQFLDTSNVTNMSFMFANSHLTTLDASNWDTSNVTDMSYMFNYNVYLTNVDVRDWNTSNVTNMSFMFAVSRLSTLDASNWDTSNVTDMSGMFHYTAALKNLDIRNWDTSNVTDMRSMFFQTQMLQELTVGKQSKFNDTVEFWTEKDFIAYTGRWIDIKTGIIYDSIMTDYDGEHPGTYTKEEFSPSINVKNITIYVGEPWNPGDNFISANYRYEYPLDLSDITVRGEENVNNKKVGTYRIDYSFEVPYKPFCDEDIILGFLAETVNDDNCPADITLKAEAVAYVTVIDKPEPTKPEPTKPEPTKPEPTKPEPTKVIKKNTYNQSGTSKLPETGEIVDGSIILTGLIVVMTSTLLFVLRKKYQGIHK